MKISNADQPCGSHFLRKIRRGVVLALLASGVSAVASATGTQWTEPLIISAIEVVGTEGGFVVYLTGFSDSNCSQDPTGIHVYPGQQGVSQVGANQILSVAIAARASGVPVSIQYNDRTTICEGIFLAY